MNPWAKGCAEIFEEAMTADYWKGTWFRDTEPDSSFAGTVGQLTAAQASTRPPVGRHTVVAHTRHALAYIEMGIAYTKGEEPKVDWEETWAVQEMNDADWDALRTRLTAACDEWRERIQANEKWDNPEWIKGTIAFVAHAAYHLGAVRQLASAYVKHSA